MAFVRIACAVADLRPVKLLHFSITVRFAKCPYRPKRQRNHLQEPALQMYAFYSDFEYLCTIKTKRRYG